MKSKINIAVWIFFSSLLGFHSFLVYAQKSPEVQAAYNDFKAGNIQESLQSLWETRKASLEKEDYQTLFEAIKYQATIFMVTGKLDSSIHYFNDGYNVAKKAGMISDQLEFSLSEIRLLRNKNLNEQAILKINSSIVYAKNHPKERSMLFQELAIYHSTELDQLDSAFFYNNVALSIAESIQDSVRISSILNTNAGFFYNKGSYLSAIDYNLQALNYAENILLIYDILNKIANTFYELKQFDKALDYGSQAYTLAHDQGLKRSKAVSELFLGILALEQQAYNKSISYFKSCLSYFDQKPNFNDRGAARINLVLSYLKSNQLDSAQTSINLVHQYYDRLGTRNKGRYLYVTGLSELKKSNHSTSLNPLLEALQFAREVSSPKDEMKTLNLLKEAYQELDPAQGLVYANQYQHLNDSLFQISQSNMLFDLEAKYHKAEQDKQIASLDATNQISTLKLQAKNRQLIFLVFGIIGISIFAYFLSRYARLRSETNKLLSQKNETISKALDEKDTLLREIHHRVKNNLQVISSLLALQSKYVRDDSALDALKQGQDRVQSMALIHQDLYQTDNLKGVDTQQYFEQLIENLFESYNISEEDIELDMDVEPIMLDVDTMIPLGLVLNELVSNALKHAFKSTTSGKIKVELKEVDKQLLLEVKDNGAGVENISILEGRSFGFELVKAFAQKLKANMLINNEDGLGIRMEIREYKKAA